MHEFRQNMFHSATQDKCVKDLMLALFEHYGDRLISLAIFGSYARGEARLNSDIDLFLVLTDLPFPSRSKTHRDFVQSVEDAVLVQLDALRSVGICMEVSPIILTKEQASTFNPLYYDMTENVQIIVDKDDFLKSILQSTCEMMKKNGTQKITLGSHWYWQTKPNPKFNEAIDYEI